MIRATSIDFRSIVAVRVVALAAWFVSAALRCDGQTPADATSASPLKEKSSEAVTAPAMANSETMSAPPRAVSPATAARINAAIPPFSGSKSTEAASAKPADQHELDKPKNQIIRLPSYIVQEPKEPVFKERDILTPAGRLNLALKRYPGLKFGNFWIFNNYGKALFMLEEDYRLERQTEMIELAGLYKYSQSPADAKAMKREVQQAFMREGGPSH